MFILLIPFLSSSVALLGSGDGGAGARPADLDGHLLAGGLGRVLRHRLLRDGTPLDRPVRTLLNRWKLSVIKDFYWEIYFLLNINFFFLIGKS